MNPNILLVNDTIANLSLVLSKSLHSGAQIVDIDKRKLHNKSMNDKLLMGLMAAGMMNLPTYHHRSIPFNLRRDNNEDALASANRKIEQAREENRKKKLAREANKV